MIRKLLKIVLSLTLALLLTVCGYITYVVIAYYRIEDNLALAVTNNSQNTIETNKTLSILSFNTGFGAYSEDYSFFMDGGEYSRAYSKDEALKNVNGMIATIDGVNPDLLLLQEVDVDATRSYHIDQAEMYTSHFSTKSHTFALNYDSPYLFYPFLKPHGKSKAGLLTLASYKIDTSTRYSLPIEKGLRKFVDLDRCYIKSTIKTDDGNELVLYNLHLSAYSSDGSIATEQLKVLFEDMKAEYANGKYIIAGGDFNKDLLGNSGEVFGISGEDYSWAKPFPTEIVPDGFKLVSGYNQDNPVASCRDTGASYKKGETFEITLDGFLVSANVNVNSYEVIDAGFKNSDHNPVKMIFSLVK